MIPAEQIAEVRTRHELVAFIESSGIKLRRKGRDLVGLCPFHNDREPSLSVSPAKQVWCCLGACSADGKKAGGDVIEFARRLWRVSFRETLDRLGGSNGSSALPAKRTTKRSAPAVRSAPHDLLSQVALFYHQTLAASVTAKDYLVSRGITNPDVVAALPIGYANGSLLERAPEGSETHAALVTLGVITAAGRELMDGCVVIPLRDLAGNVVGLYGRAIERDAHLYLPGPRRGLVNAQAAVTTSEIVITESIFDALSFIEVGIANVVPIYGTNGWTSDHDALIEQHRIRSVMLALDSDEAGQRATRALAEKLSERGIEVRAIALPSKDANELLVRDGVEQFAATWKQLITSRETAAKEEVATPQIVASLDPNDGYVVTFGRRTWRMRGLSASGVDRLRVNVRVDQDDRFHVDTFDLYSARSRRHFLDGVASALMLAESDARELQTEVAQVIDRLESERLALRAKEKGDATQQHAMSAAERDEAMELLRDPKLVDRIREDFAAAGCVGEGDALLVAYLAALSRKLAEPLAILFCARSGAGKSNLQDRITDFVPPEDLVRYTRITGQALFYQDENALKHKVLALDEEGGAAEAIYSLRILQSSGTLSVSATRTDPQTGKHRAEHYEVHGPTSIFLTTAHPEALDYETRNRFVVLTADESTEQTRRILEQQRWGETLEGLIAKKKREAVIRRHRNAQRLIEPLQVVNPHAPSLTFPSGRLILRREQKKYLGLIRAIALLHQHQRRPKSVDVAGETLRYIEVTPNDIALAQQLAPMILRRDLDELAPPTRSLLTAIGELVARKMDELKVPQQYAHLTRQEIQQATGLSYWHLRVYMGQLTECEYVAAVRGEQGKRYLYELLWDGVEDDPGAELVPQL